MDQVIISAILSLTLVAGAASLWTPISSLGRFIWQYLQKITSGKIINRKENEK